jgi:hypothetical protein
MRASDTTLKMPKLAFVDWELASIGGTSQQRQWQRASERENGLQWRHSKAYVRQRSFESVGKVCA